MATNTKSIVLTETVFLGSGRKDRRSTLTIQADDGATPFEGNALLKARAADGGLTFAPISYKRRSLNNAVSDDTVVSGAITDQPFIIEANVTGLEAELIVTRTAGELKLAYSIAED